MGQLSVYLSFDEPIGNFWIDTGLVVLLRQFGEGEHSVERVREWLVSQLVQPSGNKGKYYDQNSGQFREYDKVNWIYPANIFIKVSGSAPKIDVEIEGKKEKVFTSPPTFDLSLKFSKRPGKCDFCGDQALLAEAKMWMYPFVVDPDKFGTFYSGTKRALRLCARCALAGMAGYLGWLWKAQGNEALHFFIFHSEPREMKRLQEEVLEPLRLKGDRSGTAPVAFAGPYTHETVWGLLLKLFTHVRNSDLLSEEARDLLASLLGAGKGGPPPAPITLYAVTGKPGQAFSMRALREFSKLQHLYRLYESWEKIIAEKNINKNPHQHIIQIFEQFWAQQGQNRETILRDKIAHAILEFLDPSPFVEQFLFDARAKEENPRPLVRGTLEILGKYLQEVFGMDEQFQRILAGFGYSLGSAAREHEEVGLLYALRNAKNPEDFYRVLNDIQFRLEITVPEVLLRIEKGERIAGVPWVRVKSLLSIYAMNAYLRKTTPQSGVQTKEA
ncbi:hypothetical protein [Brockia lithotrophica]|uniref:Uncharacterized protein n=1 Tax=Brockia lithotrophica TaxID=933949 RepID=A0A660L9Q5_9BACL|nr:hypothetical protein [Brockia lithotrophica]RKQ88673.1 hypothetical protein C7438_0314 [Brockia lithotrophica]